MMEMKLNDVCRVCLANESELLSIYEDNISLSIMSIAKVKIDDSDGYPQQICHQCVQELKTAIKFKEKCELSYVRLCNFTQSLAPVSNFDFANVVQLKIEPDVEESCERQVGETVSNNAIKQKEINLKDHDETSSDAAYSDADVDHSDAEMCNEPFSETSTSNAVKSEDNKLFKPYEIVTYEYEDETKKEKVTVYKCITCGRPELNTTNIQQHKCEDMVSYDMEVFTCERCLQIVVSTNCYEAHVRAHDEVTCDKCNTKFYSKSELEQHFEQDHTPMKRTRSQTSGRAVLDGVNKLQCQICKKTCRSIRLLKLHLKKHAQEQSHPCPECSKVFKARQNLRIHLKVHERRRAISAGLHVKSYKCHICDKSYAERRYLEDHVRNHTGEKPFVCKHCGVSYAHASSLRSHSKIHDKEEGGGQHHCPTCGKSFAYRYDLIRHVRRHNGDKECKDCGKKFYLASNLASHMRVHTGEKPFTCEECGVSFAHSQNLHGHVKRMHRRDEFLSEAKRFKCHICEKQCRDKTTLRDHIETHSGERNYPCVECPKAFMTRPDLKRHLRLHARHRAIQNGTYVVEKRHTCESCGKSFTFRCDLLKHMKRHNGDKQHECKECGKRFVKNSELVSHMRVHTGEKPYTCDECGLSFAQLGNFKMHVKRIHRRDELQPSTERYPCHICNKAFKTSAYLRFHIRMHTADRNFPCGECDKAFITRSALTQHAKKHDKQRAIAAGTYVKPEKHQCETCGKSFTFRCDLAKHMKRHDGDKPHECQQCGKRFVLNHELISHMRVHTGEKPFTCDECGVSFAHAPSLKYHVTHTHRQDKPKAADDDKRFQCHICYNRFKSLRYLRTHIRMHTDQRNFLCTECNKAFVTKTALNRHLKRHNKHKLPEPATATYIEPDKYTCLYNM